MGTSSVFQIEKCQGIEKELRGVVMKKDCVISGFIVYARERLCLMLLVMVVVGLFKFFFSVGST